MGNDLLTPLNRKEHPGCRITLEEICACIRASWKFSLGPMETGVGDSTEGKGRKGERMLKRKGELSKCYFRRLLSCELYSARL